MNKHKGTFPGFPANLQRASWQFPTIINGHVHSLTGAEFKILWYILRHTYGWQKDCDYLSLSQICNGIRRRKDGTFLDKGTGLSRKWVIESLKTLEEKGFIKTEKIKGKVTLIYPKITGEENTLPPVEKSTPVAGEENTPTINTVPINNNNTSSSPNGDVKRKSISFKEEDYRLVIDEYQSLKNITLQGEEFLPVKQTIKTMFMSGRTPIQIIEAMRFISRQDYIDWTIRTVKIKLPEILPKLGFTQNTTPQSQQDQALVERALRERRGSV